ERTVLLPSVPTSVPMASTTKSADFPTIPVSRPGPHALTFSRPASSLTHTTETERVTTHTHIHTHTHTHTHTCKGTHTCANEDRLINTHIHLPSLRCTHTHTHTHTQPHTHTHTRLVCRWAVALPDPDNALINALWKLLV